MSLIFLFLSSALPLLVVAQNTTSHTNGTNAEPAFSGWVSGANNRGTFDLLLGSLTTLSLCAWTAYHPNIHPKLGHVKTFISRVKWMLLVVFIPELVLYYAWDQRVIAKQLANEVNKIQKSKPWLTDGATSAVSGASSSAATSSGATSSGATVSGATSSGATSSGATSSGETSSGEASSGSPSRPPTRGSDNAVALQPLPSGNQLEKKPSFVAEPTQWTLEHGFFVISGGLGVDTSSFWPYPVMSFTPDGVLELARRGLLPDIPLEAVEDKSKTDGFGKLLVCVQAAWFSTQIIARLIQGLPVTLLEIHVLAHVVCAFAMYFVWFKKPYDAHSPLTCTDENVINLAALFMVDTMSYKLCFDKRNFGRDSDNITGPRRDVVDIREVRSAQINARNPIVRDTTILAIRRACLNEPLDDRVDLDDYADGVWNAKGSKLDPGKIAIHLKRANRGLSYLKASENPSQTQSDEDDLFFPQILLVPFRSNCRVQGNNTLRELSGRRFDLFLGGQSWVLSLIGAAYGGVHLSTWAWTNLFPTVVELWCWRASGLAVGTAPFLMILGTSIGAFGSGVAYPGRKIAGAEKAWRRSFGCFSDLMLLFIMLAFGIVGTIYPFGRVYVLVESFASLRRTPNGTYETVDWTGFIPHVGR